MRTNIFSRPIIPFTIFLVGFFLCVSNIWGYEITILDEAKNAEAAHEMWVSENHFLPTFNNELRTDKPPLHYFFMQVGFLIFGVNELGARFFSALLGGLLFLIFYRKVKKFATERISLVATFILMSSFFWTQEFHLAVPDPYLLFFLVVGWLCFFDFFQNRKSLSLWGFYILVGLATLAKGPVAIGLSGLIALIFLGTQKELSPKKLLKYSPILGGILVLIIAAPWFWWMHQQTQGAFTEGFFVKHNFERFGNEMEGHGGIFLITWVFVLLGLFPFGAFIPQGLWHGWKFFKRNSFMAFSLIVSVVVIGFFSVSSTRLPNYTLPAMPFLAVLIAGFFQELLVYQPSKKWGNTVSMGLISLVMLALPIAVFVLYQDDLILHKQIIYTILIGIVGVVGLIFIWRNYLKNNLQNWILSIGVSWMLLSVFIFFCVYPDLSRLSPVVQAEKVMNFSEQKVIYKNYDPAFNFNYQTTFKVIYTKQELQKLKPNTLIITKDKISQKDTSLHNFPKIFELKSNFENYKTQIFQKP